MAAAFVQPHPTQEYVPSHDDDTLASRWYGRDFPRSLPAHTCLRPEGLARPKQANVILRPTRSSQLSKSTATIPTYLALLFHLPNS